MSLPARPNVGLPSTPRARSFNTGPARQSDYPPRPRSSASERPPPPSSYAPPPLPTQARTLRPQKSLNSLPSAPRPNVRSRSLDRRADPRPTSSRSEPPPPLPGLPTSRRIGRVPTQRVIGEGHRPVRSADDYPYRTRTSEDVMSDSSSGGSELSMSPSSIASSRTSLDEGESEEKGSGKPAAGHGSSLWTSITSVASNLTISVSKAWSTNVATYSGEGTSLPPFALPSRGNASEPSVYEIPCLTLICIRNACGRRVPPHPRYESLSYLQGARPVRPP